MTTITAARVPRDRVPRQRLPVDAPVPPCAKCKTLGGALSKGGTRPGRNKGLCLRCYCAAQNAESRARRKLAREAGTEPEPKPQPATSEVAQKEAIATAKAIRNERLAQKQREQRTFTEECVETYRKAWGRLHPIRVPAL